MPPQEEEAPMPPTEEAPMPPQEEALARALNPRLRELMLDISSFHECVGAAKQVMRRGAQKNRLPIGASINKRNDTQIAQCSMAEILAACIFLN